MGFRPPTPASCPIVLDRKEPGRELEPLQWPDFSLSWRPSRESVVYHHLKIPPQTLVMGSQPSVVQSLCMGTAPHLWVSALFPTPASPRHELVSLRPLLPSQFISPHPTTQPPLQPPFPCCPASKSEGPSSVPGLFQSMPAPRCSAEAVTRSWRSTAVSALREQSRQAPSVIRGAGQGQLIRTAHTASAGTAIA